MIFFFVNARWDFHCLLTCYIYVLDVHSFYTVSLELHTLQSPFVSSKMLLTRLLVRVRFLALRTLTVVPNWLHFRKIVLEVGSIGDSI